MQVNLFVVMFKLLNIKVLYSVWTQLILFRAEYKIPGLYVIDSIVRQSRHQFGPDKDVFAPRFAKNIRLTFYHLYKCSEEEKVSRCLILSNFLAKASPTPPHQIAEEPQIGIFLLMYLIWH